ncbi:MAG TPA: tRNA (adenine-N1)-methyltransferase, partial [Acidimicrobiales bacterium]|nr:tRNA (adenine-N1)-methyltransferase [Acidimicrobiales bacterium]
MALLRAGAHITGYELRPEFAERARANVSGFLGTGVLSRYDVQVRDVYEGIDGTGLDRVVLDL